MSHPLNFDLLIDRDCCIGESDWPELFPNQRDLCESGDMVPIFDAENYLVAIVPKKIAALVLAAINRSFPGDIG